MPHPAGSTESDLSHDLERPLGPSDIDRLRQQLTDYQAPSDNLISQAAKRFDLRDTSAYLPGVKPAHLINLAFKLAEATAGEQTPDLQGVLPAPYQVQPEHHPRELRQLVDDRLLGIWPKERA